MTQLYAHLSEAFQRREVQLLNGVIGNDEITGEKSVRISQNEEQPYIINSATA
jgi:hypothetical protein